MYDGETPYLTHPSRYKDIAMSSVDVSTNQLQSRGAIDLVITTESRPEILHYAGMNWDMLI
jgi:hypothetical protein